MKIRELCGYVIVVGSTITLRLLYQKLCDLSAGCNGIVLFFQMSSNLATYVPILMSLDLNSINSIRIKLMKYIS